MQILTKLQGGVNTLYAKLRRYIQRLLRIFRVEKVARLQLQNYGVDAEYYNSGGWKVNLTSGPKQWFIYSSVYP